MIASRFRCSGCGETVDEEHHLPFRCPAATGHDHVDHVVVRLLDHIDFPEHGGGHPYLTYRELLHARHFGRAHGLSEETLDEIVLSLDAAVAEVDGHGFAETPFDRSEALAKALGLEEGAVFVKDETDNVAGSHKARHLFGVLVYLDVRERAGLGPGREVPLAIASCGNAALAAAVLARAAKRTLLVFVPEGADEEVLARLASLEAEVTVCAREKRGAGDPSVARFREAVKGGALPFTCQGNENGLTIEGGHTLGWEIARSATERGIELDRLFVQVGGGALASACIGALREAKTAGVIARLPRIHAVQTAGGHPLERAYGLLVERLRKRIEHRHRVRLSTDPQSTARELRERFHDSDVQEELRHAARHRADFMWPWDEPPASLAEGILDDETYDWHAVVSGMLESGGYPLVVDELAIQRANELARRTHEVSYTGSAGLAGLLRLLDERRIKLTESIAVLFTGALRGRGG